MCVACVIKRTVSGVRKIAQILNKSKKEEKAYVPFFIPAAEHQFNLEISHHCRTGILKPTCPDFSELLGTANVEVGVFIQR